MHSAREANTARAAAIWKTIMSQGCSFGESMNDTLRITGLLFKGKAVFANPLPCLLAWKAGV